jgi:hypothetical protein
MYEPPVVPHATVPPPAPPAPDAPESKPARPGNRHWIRLVAAIAVTGLVVAGVVWLIVTTVPQSTYEETTDSLATAQADVARLEQQAVELKEDVESLQADNGQLSGEVATLRAENEQLTGEAATLRAESDRIAQGSAALSDAVVSARSAAEAPAFSNLNGNAEFFAELQAAGADFTDADGLLAELGHDITFQQWTQQDQSYYALDRAMAALADDRLWDAWLRWNQSEVGSPQETAAAMEYSWRLQRLLMQALGKAPD